MHRLKLVPLAVLLFISANVVLAQGTPQQPAPSPSASAATQPAATPALPNNGEPTVTSVTAVKPRVIQMVGTLELDDIIEVDLENLEKWAETNDASKLVPYINGRAIKGNYPEEIHLERGRLIYHLEITPDNKGVWTDLLGAPTAIRHPVTLSVGLENGSAFDSIHARDNPVILTVISPVYGLVALLVIAGTLTLLLWLARKTNIIREPGPPPAPGKRRPYNLGRAQMAFWFFLIYASYMSIWLITDALDTITPSLLALMGISAGTALGEALIDNGKDTATTNQVQDLTAERQAVEQSVSQSQSDLDANVAASATVADQSNRDVLNRQLTESRTRLGQIDQQLRVLNAQQAPTASAGFLRDILSDGSGYSFRSEEHTSELQSL